MNDGNFFQSYTVQYRAKIIFLAIIIHQRLCIILITQIVIRSYYRRTIYTHKTQIVRPLYSSLKYIQRVIDA